MLRHWRKRHNLILDFNFKFEIHRTSTSVDRRPSSFPAAFRLAKSSSTTTIDREEQHRSRYQYHPLSFQMDNTQSNSDAQTCANCPSLATRSCAGCKNAPTFNDGVHPVKYCSNACQVAGWPQHKDICKRLRTRKSLYRAGSLLQDMFYAYREQAFDNAITKIERRGQTILLHTKETPKPVVTDHIVAFPNKLVSSEEEKHAILVYSTCEDALAWMHETVEYVLKGKSGLLHCT